MGKRQHQDLVNATPATTARRKLGRAVQAVLETLEGRVLLAGNANASHLEGDWTTFGNGTAHTGYFAGTLGGDSFQQAWTAIVGKTTLNPVAVGDGRVYVTPTTRFSDTFMTAVDASTGSPLWTHSFASGSCISPPTYDGGRVYVQRGKDSYDTPDLWAINASDGNTIWSAPFSAQWESYFAPAVTEQGVWIDGGYYGGMYGFGLDGSPITFVNRAQYDQWTPSIVGGYVYSQVAGDFSKYSMTGQLQWSNTTSWNWSGWSMNRVPALADGRGFLIGNPNLYSVDLANGSTTWTVAGSFAGSPAVGHDVVYAISGSRVLSFSAGTGSAVASYDVGENIISQQPIVTDDVMMVSSANATYVLSLETGAVVERINHGGQLSLANGMLYIAGSNGELYAYEAIPPLCPVACVSTPTGAQSGSVAVEYALRDAASDPCQIQVEFSIDGGATWATATAASGGEGTTNLSSSLTGQRHTFLWDTAADIGQVNILDARLRITPTDSEPGFPGESDAFRVKNGMNSAPVATVQLSSNSPLKGDWLTATGTKTDADGDPVSLTFVWKVNGVVKRTFTSATSLSDTFDLGVAGNGDKGQVVSVEVTPSDAWGDGAIARSAATVADSAPVLGGSWSNNKTACVGSLVQFSSSEFATMFTDSDPGDTLQKIKITSLPTHGALKLGATAVTVSQEIPVGQLGSLTYTRTSGGTDTFAWRASDGILYSTTDAKVNIAVTKTLPTSVILYSPAPEIHAGETLSVNVLVTVPDASGPLPAGTVTLKDDNGAVLQTIPVANGQANSTLAGLSRGYHHITADYSGDGVYKNLTSAASLPVHVGAGNVVDILALYTTSAGVAAINAGVSIRDVIYRAVADTNDALVNSQINLSLELADVAQTSYFESGTYATDLTRLKKPSDGYMDDAASLRDTYGADLVCLFVGSMQASGIIGLGYIMNNLSAADNANWGFTEVDINTACSPTYTLAHELGHNFGAVHDHDHSDGTGIFNDSYGYRYQGSDGVWYHDIMSYDGSDTDVTIPYYSNPNVSYKGAPTGQAGVSNVARTINASAPVVANYRPTKVPLVTPTTTTVSVKGMIYANLPTKIVANVASQAANPHIPEGTVTFLDGNAVLGTGTLSNGKATWTGTLPATASHAIRALYQNDDYFGDSISAVASVTTSRFALPEHASAGTTVGSAAGSPNPGHTLSYAITGGNSAGGFAINPTTGIITVANSAVLDYEKASTYNLQITANDSAAPGAPGTATVRVNLTDVNEAPTNVGLSNTTIVDRRAAGTLVGTLNTTDPDAGNTFTYVLAGASADNASFTLVGNTLQTAAVLNAAVKSTYQINVKAIDQGGLWVKKAFTITVSPDHAPTNLALSNTRLPSRPASSTLVGVLSVTDPDPGEVITYKLGAYGDYQLFTIKNGKLKTASSLNYATRSTYTVKLRATDSSGLSVAKVFTITLTPPAAAAAMVASHQSLAGGAKPDDLWKPADLLK